MSLFHRNSKKKVNFKLWMHIITLSYWILFDRYRFNKFLSVLFITTVCGLFSFINLLFFFKDLVKRNSFLKTILQRFLSTIQKKNQKIITYYFITQYVLDLVWIFIIPDLFVYILLNFRWFFLFKKKKLFIFFLVSFYTFYIII